MPPAPPDMGEMPPAPPDMSAAGMDALLAPPKPPEPETVEESAPDISALDTPASDALAAASALAAPVEVPGTSAGATIRTSDDVDSIPGDKIIGSIHEAETATLNSDGEVVKQKVSGTLTVDNPSSSDRLWDIDVYLGDVDNTNIGGDHLAISELEAGKTHSQTYKVKNARMLIVRERIDTNPDRDQERSLSVALADEASQIAIELEVENVSAVALDDVVVIREVPSELEMNAAGAEIEGGMLTWNVGQMNSGESRTLSIDANILVDGVKPIKAGKTSATYGSNATLSTLNFRELDAFCRGFSYMVVDEDERPDNWQCQAVFENRSSFAVDLVKLQVRMSGSDQMLFDISDVEDDVLPDGKWESDVKVVEATERPDFTNELGYSVLPRVSHSTEGSLKLEEQVFEVLEAGVDKTYDAEILRSYREQVVNAKMTISNDGSSDINLMRITDDVPGLFNAPDLDALRINMNGKLLSTDQYRAELKEGVSLEDFRRSPDGAGHTLTLTIGTKGPLGLKPGKAIDITYSLTAPDPSPDNTDVAAPAKIEFSAERFGPVCSRSAANDPAIRVSHKRRKFSAGKTVIPAGGTGRYEILIMFENRSDTALKDLILHDIVPSNFEILDCIVRGAGRDKRDDVDMSSEATEMGTNVQWNVPVIGKNERLEVSYEIKGEGEFDAGEMQKFHGATFGDEVDDDPGLASTTSQEEAADEPVADAAALMKLKKAELVALAEAAGLDTSGTKKLIVERLCAPKDDAESGSDGEVEQESDEVMDVADTPADVEGAADDTEMSVEEAAPETAGVESDAAMDDDSGMPVEEAAPEAGDAESDAATDDSATAVEEVAPVTGDGDKECLACGTTNSGTAGTCITCGFVF